MNKKTGKKTISLVEFKAWLDGVEELHDSKWCPDAAQWKLIRNKIKSIDSSHTIVTTNSAPEMSAKTQHEVTTSIATKQPRRNPVNLLSAPPPPVPGGVPSGQIVGSGAAAAMSTPTMPTVEMTEAAKAAMSGRLPPQPPPGTISAAAVPSVPKSFV